MGKTQSRRNIGNKEVVMGKSARFLVPVVFFLFIAVAGCGLIGGPFDEPPTEEEWNATQSALAAQSPKPNQTAKKTPDNPLPGVETPIPTAVLNTYLPEDCIDASEVDAEVIGQRKCVGGHAYLAWQEHGTYYVDFSKEKGGFYMVGYDWESMFVVHPGDCVYAVGKVVLVNEVPAMGIDPYTLKQCPNQELEAAPTSG